MTRITSDAKKAKGRDPVAAFILLWMTIAVPLYVDDHYFNILQAKGHAFDAGCLIACALIIVASIKIGSVSFLKPERRLTDYGILIMAIDAIVSCILCGSFKEAFWGEHGWCVGGFAFLMAAILYLYLSKSFRVRQNIWLPILAVNGFIFIIGILHSVGTDAFGLHENIYPSEFYQYISTIGNVNMLVGYLCLLMPMMVCFFIEAKGPTSMIIYLIIIALGEINMILCGSDGLVLGLGVCAFFAIPYMFRNRSSSVRTSLLILIYGLVSMLLALHPAFAAKRELIGGISLALLRPTAFVGMICIGLIGILLFRKVKSEALKKILKTLVIVLEAGLGLVALYFIVKTVSSFSPNWGTGRGDIWISSVDIFRNLTPVQKLFGVGPEMLGRYYSKYPLILSKTVLAAHSEPLQILLSMGLVGVTGWILMWAGIIKKFFKDGLWETPVMAFFMPLAAYLGQSLVNTPMATNFGILIVMVSMFVYNSGNELERYKRQE